MKINVLGTEYEIIRTTSTEHPELKNADGYCANYEKFILVETDLFKDDETGSDLTKAKAERTKLILRHELVHAFVMESGNQHTSLDLEPVTHWIASMAPKMFKAFQQVDAL